jgi:hypothetical protein
VLDVLDSSKREKRGTKTVNCQRFLTAVGYILYTQYIHIMMIIMIMEEELL